MIWRRPSSVTSTVGYTLSLTYQGNTYGQSTWSRLASATIHATGSAGDPARPAHLFRRHRHRPQRADLDLHLSAPTGSAARARPRTTALRLPGPTTPGTLEPANTIETAAEPRTYGSVTHSNWVTRVTRDGVAWNYSYQAHSSQPQTRITQVDIAGPNSFARTFNILNGFNIRPRSHLDRRFAGANHLLSVRQ